MPRNLWDDGSDQDVDVDLHRLAERKDIHPSYFRRLDGLACDRYLTTNSSFRVDLPRASGGSTARDDNVQFGKMLHTWWIG